MRAVGSPIQLGAVASALAMYPRKRRGKVGGPPSSLGGMFAYYDIQDSVFSQADAVGRVKSMSDLSGSGNHMLQNTAAAQPSIVGANTAAGYLEFNGIDQFMSVVVGVALPFTMFFVGAQVTWSSNEPIWSNTGGNCVLAQNGSTPQVVTYAGGGQPAIPAAWTLGLMAAITSLCNVTNTQTRFNKTAAASAAAASVGIDSLQLAKYSSIFSNMRMKALCLYPGTFNTTDQNTWLDWASAKFNLGF